MKTLKTFMKPFEELIFILIQLSEMQEMVGLIFKENVPF